MTETLTPDLCVIGAGSAGLTIASSAAGLGASVVLIEKGAMGGDCLNVGCVPSKALIAAAKRAHAVRCAGAFGGRAGEVTVDFAAVMAHVRGVIAAIAPTDSEARYTALGVRVVRDAARFVDARTVEAGGLRIRARRTVIATGSRPAIPPVPGLAAVPYLTNETVFDLKELPPRLLILGAGPIGLELGQAFRRLGSEVTIVDAGPPLAREDPEIVAHVLAALKREGVTLHARVTVVAAKRAPDGVALVIDEGAGPREVAGTHLLIATGRKPALADLGLEAAGVRHTPAGLEVSRSLRTSNRRVYAAGDAAGGPNFTHVAGHQGGLVVRAALFGLPTAFDATPIPRVTFTDPEIATVGLDEDAARAAHKTIGVWRWPFHENDRARAEGVVAGHLKVVTDARGRVVGASLAGAQAGELIHLWAVAVQKKWALTEMASLTLPYPTLGEISRRAAILHVADRLTNPWVGRIIRFVRKLP